MSDSYEQLSKPELIARSRPQQPRPLRIVVIDDRQDSVLTIGKLLGRLDYEVATAMDGETGLQRARELRPDVILSDIGLPGMDGYDVAREVRRDPALQSTCLVAITGYGQADDQKRAYDAGYNYHLTKPIAFDELRKLLEQVQPARNGD